MHRLPRRFVACYTGYRFVWHIVAAGLTAVLVLSGFDWWFFEHTRNAPLLLVFVAGLGGFVVPITGALGLYYAGRRRAAVAFGQASFLGWFISSLYKVFTGRVQPEFMSHVQTADYSHVFNFGFLKHGIFWGWPSSHAATAVAGAVALYLVWPNKGVRLVVLVWAVVVCTGAAVGFHWFSDVIAGIIVGIVAGMAVAKTRA